jgi:transcriptional antiterminator NusG
MNPEDTSQDAPLNSPAEPAAELAAKNESTSVVDADLADAVLPVVSEAAPVTDELSAADALQPQADLGEMLVADTEPSESAEVAEGEAAGEDEVVLPPSRRSAAAKSSKTKVKPKADAKPKAVRKPARRKEKLPDLGDGSGYIAPDEVEVAGEEAPWFAVHCYSGQENKVKTNLEQRIETMGMAGKIIKIIVPTEDEIEVRDGKRKTVKRQVYPGYVLVQMHMSEESWFVVRNTPGVTRFVGMGNRPQPLSQQEVNVLLGRMEAEAPKIKVNFRAGQKVRITDGPFADFIGVVDKIDTERAKVVALVSFFGRETPVELDFLQVERA